MLDINSKNGILAEEINPRSTQLHRIVLHIFTVYTVTSCLDLTQLAYIDDVPCVVLITQVINLKISVGDTSTKWRRPGTIVSTNPSWNETGVGKKVCAVICSIRETLHTGCPRCGYSHKHGHLTSLVIMSVGGSLKGDGTQSQYMASLY